MQSRRLAVGLEMQLSAEFNPLAFRGDNILRHFAHSQVNLFECYMGYITVTSQGDQTSGALLDQR